MTKAVNERELTLEIIMQVMEEGGYSHIVIKGVLDKYAFLEKKERSFISRVASGTIEYALQADTVINKFSKTPVRKMKPFIRNLLRMSYYQLFYMDSVPDSAVCNEAVKLAKKRGFSGLSGFVNGVLRTIARKRDEITFDNLSEKYSMPQWLIDEWSKSYHKEQLEQMLSSFLNNKKISIRCNTDKIKPEDLQKKLISEGVNAEQSQQLKEAFYLSGIDSLDALESFQEGLFQVQDVSSMLAVRKAGIKQGDVVIDVCAAPGGKSLQAADLLAGTGMVEARDLTDYKVSLIQENIDRNNMNNIHAVVWDATQIDPDSVEKADVVIADLPCSGLGVIGRKPDIKYKVTSDQIDELVQLQRKILDTIHTYPKIGGTLIYSTCTVSKKENLDNVSWFLKNHPYELVEEAVQLLPGVDHTDGFFFAKFIRKG